MAKPLMAHSQEKKPEEVRKGVIEARRENEAIRNAVGEGDTWMKEQKEPFCSACVWEEYNKRKRLAEYESSVTGKEYVIPDVPDWHEFAGKQNFDFVKKNERRLRREGVVSIEENYRCKARSHGICLMDERPILTEKQIQS